VILATYRPAQGRLDVTLTKQNSHESRIYALQKDLSSIILVQYENIFDGLEYETYEM
jgi:hypothetical protein